MKAKYLFLFVIAFLIAITPLLSYADEGMILIETIAKNSYSVVAIGGLLILFFVVLASLNPNGSNLFKTVVFVFITLISVGVTLYLAGATVYVNRKSSTGGPVHWHADFRMYECGKEVFLKKPTGFSNRIGRTDLHEHGDKRIHVEGVVVERADVSLQEFFGTIGGRLAYGEIAFPTEAGLKQLVNGNMCDDGRAGTLQVFLYKTEGKEIRQSKLGNYPEYVLSGESQVPPGDCIIFEFSPDEKERTDNICDFTSIGIQKGDYNYTQ